MEGIVMINKKLKKTILKVAVPMLILTTSIGSYALTRNNLLPNSQTSAIERPKAIIENTIDIAQIRNIEGLKGVSNFFYYNGENKIAVGMNKDRDKVLNERNDDVDDKYYERLYGDIYNVDLTTMNIEKVDDLKSLNADFGAGYSPNGKYIDYVENEKNYIYNVETGKKTLYSNDEITGNWSEDSKAIIKWGLFEEGKELLERFKVFTPEGKLKYEVTLSEDVNWVDKANNYHLVNEKELYFAGRTMKGNTMHTGLYKLDMESSKLVDIISVLHAEKKMIKNPGTDLKEHPGDMIEVYSQNRIYDFSMLSNGKIVMNALINSIEGLYIYDTKTKEMKMLLDNDGGINFTIAPDESKIVYAVSNPVRDGKTQKEKHDESTTEGEIKVLPNDENIYVANISGDKLTNISYIQKDTFGTDFKWSNDSKKLLFFQPGEAVIKEVTLK